MGILKKNRRRKNVKATKAKAELKKAEARARKFARDEAKADLRTMELLDKAEQRLVKEEKKALKSKRKHEKQLAQAHLKRIEESGLTKKKAKQWTGAARALVPVLLPLIYKAWTSYRQGELDNRAAGMGLTSQDLARHSGRGAELKARIEALRANVDNESSLPRGFADDARVRLADLDQAVRNAEHASPEQQRLTHNAIEQDLTDLAAEIHAKQRG
ncbi:hypothetical protein CGLAU_11750 [Corynebacterium glaucum]|uniref:Uncharacterized protein n=1 Tax=Corynebacterium glaucum TaxID=187491 RepID=A0A1Q2HZL3_9CORY|nr:DUF6474 family protein [Corynebacterium glaucum]AQQ16281.1 hypothetical protein CGLAU_11750 [Corynebacterium glaucum]WJZ08783.1 hypothetical protein CGLAUT_11640 [Corynebacterium glaucum]